jgi:GNAT superfamily N-acetyltransferase
MGSPRITGGAELRHIEPHELQELLGLYRHLHAEDAPLPSDRELQRLWQEILANPLLHYLVAQIDGRIVATCTLAIIPNLTRGARPYGLIENVVTHPDYRRRGLGKRLLKYALEIAWEQRCYKVMLMTGRKTSAVLGFYESVGFDGSAKSAFVVRNPRP